MISIQYDQFDRKLNVKNSEGKDIDLTIDDVGMLYGLLHKQFGFFGSIMVLREFKKKCKVTG